MNRRDFVTNFLQKYFLYLGIFPFIFLLKGLLAYPFSIPLTKLAFFTGSLLIICYLLYKLSLYFLKDTYKAAYLLLFILLLCFSSVDLYFIVFSAFLRIRYYLIGLFLSVVFCFWFLKSTPVHVRINTVLNIFSLIFCCIYLINNQSTISNSVEIRRPGLNKPLYNEPIEPVNPSCDSVPDIYVLLMDGYANSHNLKKYWHFSNDLLIDNLRTKGFHVIDSSKSNYFYTVQTVSSMLNMAYHQTDKPIADKNFLLDIANNIVVERLVKNGYKIDNYSLFDFTGYPSSYRLNLFPGTTSLIDYFLSQTVYYFIVQFQTDHNAFSDRRRNITTKLIELAKTNTNQPKFIYAHFFVTHPPFYLDSLGRVNGKLLAVGHHTRAETESFFNSVPTDDTLTNRKTEQTILDGYLNHIKEANRILNSLVLNILTNSKRPPIILIMSDHGYRFLTGVPHQEMVDERYGNLCAFYFPDKNYRMIEKTITPVNYMRLILSKALGTPYHPLADKSHLEIN